MLRRDYAGQNCSIARALEVVGDRWTLLIVRDILFGARRFDELASGLDIATNVLSDRLSRLVEEGILERRPYGDRPDRFEYRLTKRGEELRIVLLALLQWGDGISEKPPRIVRRRSDGARIRIAPVTLAGEPVAASDLEVVRGPGAEPLD